MDEGTLFLLICFTVVTAVLGGYAWYLYRRGRAAMETLQAGTPSSPVAEVEPGVET